MFHRHRLITHLHLVHITGTVGAPGLFQEDLQQNFVVLLIILLNKSSYMPTTYHFYVHK